jgi:hypothetical protein
VCGGGGGCSRAVEEVSEGSQDVRVEALGW